MTETIFAIAILFSLVVLGGLISIGNERQRKAIDKLNKHAQAWAIEDLRLKRGQIEGNISIEDPVVWLSTAASRALGRQMQLSLVEVFENPTAISCVDNATGDAIIFSQMSPKELHALSKEKRGELSKRGVQHPLMHRSKSIEAVEMNILNAGIHFDLEINVAWKKLSSENASISHIWLYMR